MHTMFVEKAEKFSLLCFLHKRKKKIALTLGNKIYNGK